MTDADREYELEEAVRLLGFYMKELRLFERWQEPEPEEAGYLADLRRNVAEGKRKVAALLARDPETASDPPTPKTPPCVDFHRKTPDV